jgi:hypothetical protein
MVTRELLCQWGACWSDAQMAQVPPEGLTPLGVLDMAVPERDLLRVLLRKEVTGEILLPWITSLRDRTASISSDTAESIDFWIHNGNWYMVASLYIKTRHQALIQRYPDFVDLRENGQDLLWFGLWCEVRNILRQQSAKSG